MKETIPTDKNLKTIIRDCFKDFQQATAKIPIKTREIFKWVKRNIQIILIMMAQGTCGRIETLSIKISSFCSSKHSMKCQEKLPTRREY